MVGRFVVSCRHYNVNSILEFREDVFRVVLDPEVEVRSTITVTEGDEIRRHQEC